MAGLCAFVVCGAPLAARAPDIAAALAAAGWRLQVITTPSARTWVDDSALAALGQPARSGHRPVDVPKDRTRPDVVVVAPITFNTVGKLASGIADTYAHSLLCEALGEALPIVAAPMVNSRLWGHPAWEGNLGRLTQAGVRWLSIHDGTIGVPRVVQSGTGDDLVKRFDPEWIVRALGS